MQIRICIYIDAYMIYMTLIQCGFVPPPYTKTYAWHDSFTRVTYIRVKRRIHKCDMTPTCEMTRSHEWYVTRASWVLHGSCVWVSVDRYTYEYIYIHIYIYILNSNEQPNLISNEQANLQRTIANFVVLFKTLLSYFTALFAEEPHCKEASVEKRPTKHATLLQKTKCRTLEFLNEGKHIECRRDVTYQKHVYFAKELYKRYGSFA